MNRKPGDWNCRSCHHLNFSRRDLCQRCGHPRAEAGTGAGSPSFGSGGPAVRPGDWYCRCGAHNFASRSSCFKCGDEHVSSEAGVPRSRGFAFGGSGSSSSSGARAGWKTGDWICSRSGCSEHNFASRMECFRCNAPRDYGTED